MSGQPLQKPLDATKFRQQYLANIKLQTKIDEMNYQANRVYKKTGAAQQPTDQRTLNEKFRDIMGLKVEIRSMLKEITTGEQAQEIVNELSPNEVQYCYSNLPELIKILKPKYKGGVPAYIFLHTFRKFVSDEADGRDIQRGFPQQNSGENIILSIDNMTPSDVRGDLDSSAMRGGITTQAQLLMLLDIVSDMSNRIGGRTKAEDELDYLVSEVFPSQDEVAYMYAGEYTGDYTKKKQIIMLINELVEDIPSYNQIEELIRKGQFVDGRESADIFLDDVVGICAITPQLREQMEVIRNIVDEAVREEADFARAVEEEPDAEWVDEEDVVAYAGGEGGIIVYIDPDNTNASLPKLQQYLKDLELADSTLFGRSKGEGRSTVSKTKPKIKEFLRKYDADIQVITGAVVASADAMTIGTSAVPMTEAEKIGGPMLDADITAGVVGLGLRKKGGRPRTRSVQGKGLRRSDHLLPSDVDITAGIPPAARFMPMGKLIINRNRLADNVISVKTLKGGFVKEFKSKKVSHNLANVIRKITGGGMLGYSDFDKMSQPEKDYLHSLSKRANILDKIDIPAPRIDNDEKDIRQFEIMKGEMMAGNNNEQMIRRFKQMIVKLLDKGVLPKGEGRDILVELTKAGF